MALSRSEIEILIKARNEAQGAFDSLSKQVSGVTGASSQATQGLEQVGTATKHAATAGQGASVMFGLLAERLARGLVGVFGEAVSAANRLDSGLIGLSSVAKAFHQDAGAAQSAAQALAADGLMGVGDAATSLKNLLAAGFGLDQAVVLMNRFKDSAAFGRQGSLDFGEAIRGATEGIKNGNSVLVDNAGVTKNLSQMLVEAGYSAQDLSKASSDVNVRMAIFNGIIKETNPQVGDAARFLGTAAGQQAAFSAQVEITQQKIGKALQPALSSLLDVLTPVIKGLGNSTAVLLPLGAAIGAIVIPMGAMAAASALGIPPVSVLTASLGKLWATASLSPVFGAAAATVSAGSVVIGRSSLILDQYGNAAQTVGVKTAEAAPKIGLMTKAIGIFVAWEVGKALGNLVVKVQEIGKESESTGGKVAAFVMKYTGLGAAASLIQNVTEASVTAASGTASLATQVNAMKQASDLAGRAVLSYAEAIRILESATNPAEASMRSYWATLTKPPNLAPTLAQGQALADQFDKIAGAADASKARIAGWEGELYRVAMAGGLKTLRSELDLGVLSTKELSAQFGISEDAIKFYEKRLKTAADAQKQATQAGKDHRTALAALTAITKTLTESERTRIDNLIRQGADEKTVAELTGIHEAAVRRYIDAIKEQKKAEDDLKEFRVEHLRAWVESNDQAAEAIMDKQRALMKASTNQIVSLFETDREYQAKIAEQRLSGTKLQIYQIDQAYRAEIASLGNRTTANAAFWDAAKAKIDNFYAFEREKATSFWAQFVPEAKQTLTTLQTAINGTFAQMLLGAKSFGDGWKDIWNSIKSATLNILNEILSKFLNQFLKGMLGAMAGEQGAFSSAFAGLFSGGGGGGLMTGGGGSSGGGLLSAAGKGLAGLFGGGGGLSASSGGLAAGLEGAGSIGGATSGAGGAAAGGAGAGALSWLGGAAAAGMAGWQLGNWGESLFGGAGAKAGAFGAGTGAAAGAAIGSILPGIGTAAGAIVGAIAGLLSGVIGKSVGEKANDIRDKFFEQFGAGGTGEGSGFLTVASELAKLSVGAGGGEGGGSLFKNLIQADNVKELEAAVRAVEAALKGAEYATIKVGEATDLLTQQRTALTDAGQAEDDVLKDQAASYSALLDMILTTGATAPDSLKPILERLVDMGLLVDSNGVKIEDLSGVKFAELGSSGSADVAKLTKEFARLTEEGDQAAGQADALREQIAILGPEGGDELQKLQQAMAAVTDEEARIKAEAKVVGEALAKATTLASTELDNLNADVVFSGTIWREYGIKGKQIGLDIIDGLSDVGSYASDVADEVGRAFGNLDIEIPVKYSIPPIPGTEPGPIPGAAHGVIAGQPGLVVFGEGGETEVGGPASFFRGIFESLGINNQTTRPAESAPARTDNRPIVVRLELGGKVLNDYVIQVTNAGLADGTIRPNRRGLVERAF